MEVLMKKRIISIVFVVALLCVMMLPQTAEAKKTTDELAGNIAGMQDQISAAQKEKEELKNSVSDLQKVKEQLEAKKNNLQDYVVQLDDTLERIEKNIADLRTKITTKETEIVEMEAKLEEALRVEAVQKKALMVRIRLMYEKMDPTLVMMLSKSDSFGDFLNRADYMEKVMAYDKMRWEEFILNRQMIELYKTELETEKQILNQAKVNIEIEQSNLESLIAQKNVDIVDYESDIDNKEQAIKEYQAAIASQDAEIAALESAIIEERKKLLEANGQVPTYNGGAFKMPLASYTRISSDYGMRLHPTLGVEVFHSGVDFAAPKGTAIYAAYDGVVIASAYSPIMGNYIMVDHGGSLFTIYMHASALYVNKGDAVVKGEVIASVGSTGRSTGPHLHFGVREGGQYVSPWNYLSQ